MTNFCRFIKRFFKEQDELYIDQPIVDRYSDFQEIGTWGSAIQNQAGDWESNIEGKMFAETVKYVGKNKQVKLGRRWFPDYELKK